MTRRQRVGKRTIDVVLSLALLIILSPLFLLVALMIVLDSRGGVFYRQPRAGLGGRPFLLYKFRTMVPGAEKMGAGYYFSGPDDPRITRVGRFLRRTSLDELPQLINVLKGDMSLVGPRPMLLYQVEKLSPGQKKRLSVRPGITGWAQINGRAELSWSKRIEYDLWYIDNYSLCLDLKILLRTPLVVIRGTGLGYHVTPEDIEDFSGKDEREKAGAGKSGNENIPGNAGC